MRSSTYSIWTERSNPYIKTFSTLSGVRTVFLILLQLALHKCSKTIPWLKRQFTVHVSPVSCAIKFTKGRKTCYWVIRTSILSILYSGELCNNNYIVKTSETLIVWRMFCYTAGSDKSDAIEGVPDKLLKGAAMVFRVHSRHDELVLTYWCSQSTLIVILRQLRVIIGRHA